MKVKCLKCDQEATRSLFDRPIELCSEHYEGWIKLRNKHRQEEDAYLRPAQGKTDVKSVVTGLRKRVRGRAV